MTAPTEKAAPIPADIWRLADTLYSQTVESYVETRPQFKAVERIARALADRASQQERITRADLASLLEEVRRPTEFADNHIRQIADRIERMMEVAGGQEERIREVERDRLYAKTLKDRDQARHDGLPLSFRIAADAGDWIRTQGAMLPADRARLRGDAS